MSSCVAADRVVEIVKAVGSKPARMITQVAADVQMENIRKGSRDAPPAPTVRQAHRTTKTNTEAQRGVTHAPQGVHMRRTREQLVSNLAVPVTPSRTPARGNQFVTLDTSFQPTVLSFESLPACVCVCVCVFVRVCVCLCLCVCLYIHTHIHTYIHTYIRKYIFIFIHTYMTQHIHTCVHTYIHTYRPYICKFTPAHRRVCLQLIYMYIQI